MNMTPELIDKLNLSDMPQHDKMFIWYLTYKENPTLPSKIRIRVMSEILLKQPEFICIGLVNTDEILHLLDLNRKGIIKHILFLECDAVECYIHCVWR